MATTDEGLRPDLADESTGDMERWRLFVKYVEENAGGVTLTPLQARAAIRLYMPYQASPINKQYNEDRKAANQKARQDAKAKAEAAAAERKAKKEADDKVKAEKAAKAAESKAKSTKAEEGATVTDLTSSLPKVGTTQKGAKKGKTADQPF